jgi:hypothetical protein
VRRQLYWLGVLAGVLLLAGGAAIAVLGYARTAGPDGAVRGYFAALSAGDAPTALAYGDVPAGPRRLLSSAVLREQQHIAPLRAFSVVATRRQGDKAQVQVTYTLAFPGADVAVAVTVPVHRSSGDWRLDRVAVPIELVRPGAARQRQAILGTRVPRGPTLLFPGALPITLDTPYLKLDPFADSVGFDSLPVLNVRLQVTAAARAAFTHDVTDEVRRCVTSSASAACPLPDERYVPGSVHGRVQRGLHATRTLLDEADPVGTLRFSGRMTVDGSYRRLNFHNRQVTGHGLIYVDIHVAAYAVAPLRLRWTSS